MAAKRWLMLVDLSMQILAYSSIVSFPVVLLFVCTLYLLCSGPIISHVVVLFEIGSLLSF